MMSSNPIYCPVCEKQLVITHYERYQDISEHACDPNGRPSLKCGYQCPDPHCLSSLLNYSWIESGEAYPDPPKGISWSECDKRMCEASKSGMDFALNSWQHYYQDGKNKREKRAIKIKLFNYRIDFEPKPKGHKYPVNKQYLPSLFRWSVTYWKKDKDGMGYLHLIPDWRMVKFCINKFKKSYNLAVAKRSKRDIKECLEMAECRDSWGYKDDRRYRRIAGWIIRNIFKGRYQIIKALQTSEGVK